MIDFNECLRITGRRESVLHEDGDHCGGCGSISKHLYEETIPAKFDLICASCVKKIAGIRQKSLDEYMVSGDEN